MDNSRLFLYAALAFVGLLIWEQWKADYGPQPEPVVQQQQQSSSALSSAPQTSQIANDLPELANIQNEVSPDSSNNAANNSGKLIYIETDVFEAQIDTLGGVIKSLKLKNYPVDLEHPNEYLELVHSQADSVYLVQNGLRSSASAAPTHYSSFTTAEDSYVMEESADVLRVPFQWNEGGIQVIKTYEFKRGDYLINLNHRVINQSNTEWVGSQYRQLQRSRPLETSKLLYTYTGAVVYNDEIKYEKIDFDDMEEKAFQLESSGGWAAMIHHYFLTAWIAKPEEKNLLYSIANTKRYPATYTIGMRSDNQQISAGSEGEFNSQLFGGPKLVNRLEEISPGLDLTVDYGALTFLSKPLYWLLSFFYDIVGNWGLAIILLTLTVKAIFYKLSEKSYKSMARMRKVGPRLKALKERYGDDRQQMNKAMMELYKTEKINPMGGCLPMLVQMPVFIALYWALLESVDLRQAPFIFWIQDLSVMDPYYILPVIMGISMIIQQKLSPTPMADPVQAKMMMALPLVFTVFFAFFPAGLVLYWVSNNILTISQQWVITKRIDSGEEK
ncbi:MAG: membrane protein insertase YidC [Gammaproteobacteria bacterium]|nr:membrane protein insertase YidC [Gammaproteobacteria bacterium]